VRGWAISKGRARMRGGLLLRETEGTREGTERGREFPLPPNQGE